MTITAFLVLFAVFWFLCLFVVLPLGVKTQNEAGNGDVVPGTPASAPDEPMMKKKMIWATIGAVILTAIVTTVVLSDIVSVRDFDFFHRMG